MPSSTAKRLCPEGIFIAPRMNRYREESAAIIKLIALPGIILEQVSVDEAYLDVSALSRESEPDSRLSEALPLARDLKQKILRERGLTATIGVAANKLLAKLASDFDKPDGLTLISESEKVQFLRPLSVRLIHGVGKVTEEVLNRAGVETIGDLQDYSGDLRALAGSFGPTLKRFSFGEDDRPIDSSDEIKSISSETTFLKDTEERTQLRACLREQAEEISTKLKAKQIGAQTVQIKLRYGDFSTLTRQLTVEEPIVEAKEIYRLACHILAREGLVSRPLRLLGLGVSGFGDAHSKQLIFDLPRSRI